MQQTLTEQILIFLYSCLLGITLGLLYDAFRIIRMIINSMSIMIFFQDILYFIVSGIVTFIFILGFNSGDSRFYILAGEGIGWIGYHLTIGELIYRMSNKTVKAFKNLLGKLKNKIMRKRDKKEENE